MKTYKIKGLKMIFHFLFLCYFLFAESKKSKVEVAKLNLRIRLLAPTSF